MRKTILTALIAIVAITAQAQTKPKQHVFYDTVKTVHTRIDYSPDTISVYFKEIIIDTNATSSWNSETKGNINYKSPAYEHLTPGFIIWQTYEKQFTFTSGSDTSGFQLNIASTHPYYFRPYLGNSINYHFLYLDKRPVTNKVIYSIKR